MHHASHALKQLCGNAQYRGRYTQAFHQKLQHKSPSRHAGNARANYARQHQSPQVQKQSSSSRVCRKAGMKGQNRWLSLCRCSSRPSLLKSAFYPRRCLWLYFSLKLVLALPQSLFLELVTLFPQGTLFRYIFVYTPILRRRSFTLTVHQLPKTLLDSEEHFTCAGSQRLPTTTEITQALPCKLDKQLTFVKLATRSNAQPTLKSTNNQHLKWCPQR